ncbi:MAG TPA: hypothetical protein VFZ64_02380 [Nocardioidaceae bacterium]
MSNISTTPAPARTDVRNVVGEHPAGLSDTGIRRLGLALAGGAVSWSAANFVFGFSPDSELGLKVTDLTGFAFQLGVLALLQLQTRTRATGTSRKAMAMLRIEKVLLGLAMVWSLVHALVPSARGTAWLAALDVFWPLSMLGMFIIGIKVVVAGRWRGAARVWPGVAESWAVVCVPLMGIFGSPVGDIAGATHLLVGYATLGLIIAARPDLVRDRG